MAGNDNISLDFILNLDDSAFAQKVTDSLSGVETLASNLGQLAEVGGAVGVAFLTMKAALGVVELEKEAENIRALEMSFAILSEQVGVTGETLKNAMNQASLGTLTETQQLKLMNSAMVLLGDNSNRIPEIFELSRKAASVFGGTASEAFETLSRAMATGQARALKQYGITVDTTKATRDYASALGVTESSLSEVGKRHAFLNAAMQALHEKLDQLPRDLKPATTAWDQFRASLSGVGETATKTFSRIFGPNLRAEIELYAGAMQNMNTWFKATFGEGAEQAAAKTELLRGKIHDTQEELASLEAKKSRTKDAFFSAEITAEIDRARERLKAYQAELGSVAQEEKKVQEAKQDRGPAGAPKRQPEVDLVKAQEQRARFNQEIVRMRQQAALQMNRLADEETKYDIKQMTTVSQADALYNRQRIEAARQFQTQIDAIKGDQKAERARIQADVAAGKITQAQAAQELALIRQKDAEIVALNRLKNKALVADDMARWKLEQQAMQQNVNQSKTAAQGFSSAFQKGSAEAKHSLTDFGKMGESAVASLSQHSVSAFEAMGAGTASACDAMKQIFFGMVGDQAEQYGEMMLLASVWPPNPAGLAAGAGLLALAGFLKGQAGGSTSAVSGSVTSSSVDTGSGTLTSLSGSVTTTPLTQGTPKSTVNITIQGHLFQNQESQNWLVSTIRAAQDGADFNIAAVN